MQISQHLSYFFEKTNTICYIEVTFWKNKTLYTVPKLLFKNTEMLNTALKLLFEKNERYTLYQSYFLKKPNSKRCIASTFQSNLASFAINYNNV